MPIGNWTTIPKLGQGADLSKTFTPTVGTMRPVGSLQHPWNYGPPPAGTRPAPFTGAPPTGGNLETPINWGGGGGNLEAPVNWHPGGGWQYAGGDPLGNRPAYHQIGQTTAGPWATHFRQIMRNRGGF
jgi:hypothetical protein